MIKLELKHIVILQRKTEFTSEELEWLRSLCSDGLYRYKMNSSSWNRQEAREIKRIQKKIERKKKQLNAVRD